MSVKYNVTTFFTSAKLFVGQSCINGTLLFLHLHHPFYQKFFADVRDAQERMKKMQETMKKKYMCDRTTTATRLEDLLQDAVVSFSI